MRSVFQTRSVATGSWVTSALVIVAAMSHLHAQGGRHPHQTARVTGRARAKKFPAGTFLQGGRPRAGRPDLGACMDLTRKEFLVLMIGSGAAACAGSSDGPSGSCGADGPAGTIAQHTGELLMAS